VVRVRAAACFAAESEHGDRGRRRRRGPGAPAAPETAGAAVARGAGELAVVVGGAAGAGPDETGPPVWQRDVDEVLVPHELVRGEV